MVAVRRLFVALVAGLIIGVGSAPIALAAPSQLTPAGQEGLEQIATCLRSNPNLVALLVVDESGSLEETDPENRRADILADFVLSLSSLAGQETPQGPRTVEFAANTFAIDSQPLVPWTTLTPANAQDISARMRSDIPALNQGGGTNYEAAVKGARGSIAEGVSRVDAAAAPCKIVVWFTDGILSVGDDAANAASAERLCSADGPVNSLRKEQINLISVLLFDRDRLRGTDEQTKDLFNSGISLLQATAEGTGSAGRFQSECGRVPIPDDFSKGAFFEGNLDALAGQFSQAIALGSGGTALPDLKGSPVAFTIEPGFTSFWVTALAPDGFTLEAPVGAPLTGSTGSAGGTVAGAQAEVTWSGETFTAKVPVASDGIGQWTLTRPGMSDPVGVYLFSDYRLTVNPVELVAGEEATITGSVTDADGVAADLTGFSSAELSVTQVIDGQQVDPIPFDVNKADGTFTGTFTPETTSTEVRFDLTLKLITQSQFPLAPLTTTFVQQVKLPGAYPQLSPAVLDLGSVQNRGDTSSGSLQIQGSPDGATTVCVRGVVIDSDLPEAQVGVSANPATGCIDVGQNGAAVIDVSALLGSAVADGGQVSGFLDLSVTNAPTPDLPETRERSIQVPFSVQVVPVGPVLWVPFALTALGVVVPLLLLWFVNWRAARLRLDGIMMARIPVRIPLLDAGAPQRADGQPGPLLTYEDLSFAPAPARARSWTPGIETLRARTPWNPFGSVTARVVVPESHAVVSNQPPNTSRSGSEAGVSLCPSMTAYVVLSRTALAETGSGDSAEGELVAFLIPSDLQKDSQLLASSITSFAAWGELLSQIKAQSNSQPVSSSAASESVLDVSMPSPETGRGSRFDTWTPPASTKGTAPSAPPPGGPSDDPPPPNSGNRFTL